MSNSIAISGMSGCGNTTTSKIIAEKLGFQLVNYTFHTIAEEMGIEFKKFCKMAEEDSKWDYMVDEKQVELAMSKDSVLGSRLAIWMLKDAKMKVYLTASPEIRARRINKREGGSIEQKMAETKARDTRDSARYKNLYNIDNQDYSFADIIINTDELTAEQTADMIIECYKVIK